MQSVGIDCTVEMIALWSTTHETELNSLPNNESANWYKTFSFMIAFSDECW